MGSLLFMFLLLPIVDGVLEQVRDSNNVISWKTGHYRNRNVIPMPNKLDLEKKHKRDAEETNEDRKGATNKSRKKSFLREHFSLPIGAQIPIGYNGMQKKGKKSEISNAPLSKQLADHQYREITPALEKQENPSKRNSLGGTWGMVWEDPHPNPELHRDTAGYERSTLYNDREKKLKNGKISEQEFDSGLMGRGLGGMTERAQNENLMEQKFEEQMEDESDVENETNGRRPRRLVPLTL